MDSGLLVTCVDYQIKKQLQHYPNRADIIQDAWEWLLTYDERKLIDAAEGHHLNALITRYLQNQMFSRTSKYYRNYVKNNTKKKCKTDAKGTQSGIRFQ